MNCEGIEQHKYHCQCLAAKFLGLTALGFMGFSQAVIVYCTQRCNYPPIQESIEGRLCGKSGGLRHP